MNYSLSSPTSFRVRPGQPLRRHQVQPFPVHLLALPAQQANLFAGPIVLPPARPAVSVLVARDDGGDVKLYLGELYAARSTLGARIAKSSITALALATGSVEAPASAR